MSSRTRVESRIDRFVADKRHAAERAMTAALILGASEASVMTPIDTSTLLNSQFKAVSVEGAKIIGRVGYTASYALPVHDPDHPQNFRRASAEKEFLKHGFERAEPHIRAVIRGALKV